MNRRSFLTGLLASAAPLRLPGIAVAMPIFGRSSAMDALPNLRMVNAMLAGMAQKIESTVIYGNDQWGPMQFTGLAACYDAPNHDAP